jgi:hypothetical protein
MRAATVRTIALGLPETEERETWGEATFRVRTKIFLMLDPDGKRASVKSTHDEQSALLAEDPETFFRPEYVGVHGWIGVVVVRADRDEMRELIIEAWRMTAPKRIVTAFDEEHG